MDDAVHLTPVVEPHYGSKAWSRAETVQVIVVTGFDEPELAEKAIAAWPRPLRVTGGPMRALIELPSHSPRTSRASL